MFCWAVGGAMVRTCIWSTILHTSYTSSTTERTPAQATLSHTASRPCVWPHPAGSSWRCSPRRIPISARGKRCGQPSGRKYAIIRVEEYIEVKKKTKIANKQDIERCDELDRRFDREKFQYIS